MKVLILGIRGMLGHQVYIKFKKSNIFSSIRGTIKGNYESVAEYSFFNKEDVYINIDFEFDGFEKLYNIIKEYNPDIVINCVAIKNNLDFKKSLLINSFLPHFIANTISKTSKFIQISTDAVFSGNVGFYSEKYYPDPTDIYSKSKLFGEVTYNNNLSIRTSIFGHGLSKKEVGVVDWFLNSNDKIEGFSDYYFSGVSTNYLSTILIDIIKLNLSGIINISSSKISKYDLLVILNEVYNCKKNIKKKYIGNIDRSLNPTKMTKALNTPIPDVRCMIEEMKKEVKNEDHL